MIDIEKLPQVCISYFYRDCKDMFHCYIEKYYDEIAYFNKNYPCMIRLHNGNEIYFITQKSYDEQWCKGRTYRFYGDDRVYRSGYPVQVDDKSFVWLGGQDNEY